MFSAFVSVLGVFSWPNIGHIHTYKNPKTLENDEELETYK